MAQQLDKISDATALIVAMVTRSRAAQSVLGKSDFASRCAALQAAADEIPPPFLRSMPKMLPRPRQAASAVPLSTG